ncbi:hypothetical protein Tco_1165812 [Tanacetum coccineum]
MEVSLECYVKDIFDKIDRNQQSYSMQISNIENLASKMSIQFSQFGAGNPKPRYESSIGVEIEKMNVETLALGSRNCDNDHELEKVEVAHKAFNEMPKVNLWVGHKVFDELPKGKISSVKEYHNYFCSILDGSKVSPECGLSCFIDGLKEEIQEMVMLFKPQTIHEACCLAKLQELTLNARKPKELIKPASLNTQNRSRKEYPEELRSVDCYAINPDFQAMLQYDAHVGRF